MTTANTILSDINEIYTGYVLAGNKWFDIQAKNHYMQRIAMAEPHEVLDAQGKATAMAKDFLTWASNNGYRTVKDVWWTARPGSMASAVGQEVDQKKNPTDILVKFLVGPSNGFLGLSAKATKTSGEIGFKNPGVGTVDKSLSLSLAAKYKTVLEKTIKDLDLPDSADKRKIFLRQTPKVREKTEKIGSDLLSTLRDDLLVKLKSMKNKELLSYLLVDWMNADVMYPPYIKVTGQGNKAPYRATVMNPTDNPKLEALANYDITLSTVGNESIGVMAGDKKIMKIRFKFESEKMASSMKLSGDPW